MPRIASTAKPATSRTRPRTSTGSLPKAAEGPITRTCSLALAVSLAALAAATPAAANPVAPERLYIAARAASLSGDHGRSAQLFAALAQAQPSDVSLGRRAIGEAISAGDMATALTIARRQAPSTLPVDARLLLIADALRRGRHAEAGALLTSGDSADLGFLKPMVAAWAAAEGRDEAQAMRLIGELSSTSLLGPFANEQRALLLLKLRRTAAAEPYASNALTAAAGREHRLRLAFADGFLAAGDQARALKMVEGDGGELARARARIAAGRGNGQAIDTAAKGFSEYLLSLAIELTRSNRSALPTSLAQIARFAAPDSSSAAILLGVLLERSDRTDDAIAAFRSVRADDGLASQALDSESQALVQAKRFNEALARARAAASARDAGAGDFARLGDVLSAMERHAEAAEAYNQALARADSQPAQRWPLLLLKASALEEAERWPESKQALEQALALAPEQPLVLNFLGYSKLERGEDLDAAEAMIRKASALDPDNASITDSLGWAQFKRGKYGEAIETLQRAAAGDPGQAEIHEHLGDALFSAGRRYEARFAWQAALITAEEGVASRIKAKIESGLTPATAAP